MPVPHYFKPLKYVVIQDGEVQRPSSSGVGGKMNAHMPPATQIAIPGSIDSRMKRIA